MEKNSYNTPETIINASSCHIALLFLIDTSLSVQGDRIRALNEGMNKFKEDVCKDSAIKRMLDVAIIKFDEDYEVLQHFKPVEEMMHVDLVANSRNAIYSGAIKKSLIMVQARTKFYHKFCESYKPWIVLISCSIPTDDITDVAQEVNTLSDRQKLMFVSLGVEGYDSMILHTLSSNVMKLEGTDFTEFFNWVNKSLATYTDCTRTFLNKPLFAPLSGNVKMDILDT